MNIEDDVYYPQHGEDKWITHEQPHDAIDGVEPDFIDRQHRPVVVAAPVTGTGISDLLWKLGGWGYLWGGGSIGGTGASDADINILDPHSAKTLRLLLAMSILLAIVMIIAWYLTWSWIRTGELDSIVLQGHANARYYRTLKQKREKKKKKE